MTTTEAGPSQWLGLPLSVPLGATIKKITVCYSVTNPASFISQIRLTQQVLPPSATVVHDDGTDLVSTVPVCATSLANVIVNGAITLNLRLDFASTAHSILIGSVFVEIEN